MKKTLLPITRFFSKLLIISLMFNGIAFINLSTSYSQSVTDVLQELNKATYVNENFANFNVTFNYSLNTKHPRITIEKNGKIYGTTVDSIFYDEGIPHTIYAPNTDTQIPVMRITSTLYKGEHMPIGKYDLVVDDGTNKEIFTDKLIVHDQAQLSLNGNLFDYPIMPTHKQVFVGFKLTAGEIKDFTAVLTDKNGLVVSKDSTFMITRLFSTYQQGRIKFNLNEGLSKENAPYKVKVTSKKEFTGETSETITLAPSSSYVTGNNTPQNPYATFNIWLNAPITNTIIATLSDSRSKMTITQKIYLKNSPFIDLQFIDAKGQVLKLNPGHYTVRLKTEDQKHIGNVFKTVATNQMPSQNSYITFSQGKLYAGIEIPNTLIGKSFDKSNFHVEIQNVIKELPPIKIDQWTIKEDKKLDSTRHFITFEKTAPQNILKGNYFASAYYGGNAILDKTQNIVLANLDPIEINDPYTYSAIVGPLSTDYNGTKSTSGFIISKQFLETKRLKLQLMPINDRFGESIKEIPLNISDKSSQHLITKANSKHVDLYKYYSARLVNDNNQIVHEGNFYQGYAFQPTDETKDSKTYTIKSGALKNGTLTFNMTKGLKRQEVVVLPKPNAGYQYKPNSVKVNGVPIDGRFFMLKENAVVTAEFEPVNQ